MSMELYPAYCASRLPMRNWNHRWNAETRTRTLWLPDYLWGIETRLPLISGTLHTWLPDYLWGIETLTLFLFLFLFLASRLPMRNWNIHTFCIPPHLSLPDYLWGIETGKISTYSSYQHCFQTTYEELKLPAKIRDMSLSLRFQTTYEELKL